MSRTVLLIEDNAQNRYLATFLLEHSGYRVVAAVDGPEGIRKALELLPADVSLESVEDITGSDPLALLRAAEKVLRRCPVEDLPAGGSQLVVEVCDLMSELAS